LNKNEIIIDGYTLNRHRVDDGPNDTAKGFVRD
jgi:hypothetical protein